MKKLILVIAVAMQSCVTTNKYSPTTSGEYLNNKESFTLLGNRRVEITTKQACFFVPIGQDETQLQYKALNLMLKDNAADGIFLATYFQTVTRYPFFRIVVTELSGQPYKIK